MSEDEAQLGRVGGQVGQGLLGHWNRLTAVKLAPVAAPEASARPARLFQAPGFTPVELRLPVDLPAVLRELEEAFIAEALAATEGNKKEAAALLGMGRTTLVEKLRRRAALRGAGAGGCARPGVPPADGDVFGREPAGP